MKIGLYYSQAQEYDDPDGYMATGDNFVTSVHMRTGRKLMNQKEILQQVDQVIENGVYKEIRGILLILLAKLGFDEGA